jgi:uncharacterized protein (DUF1800 family)
MKPRRSGIVAAAMLLALGATALNACGGGGGSSSGSGGGGPTVPPPPPPAAPKPTEKEAFRFLEQASFGPIEADLSSIVTNGYEPWIMTQMGTPTASHVAALVASGQTEDGQLINRFSQSVWGNQVFSDAQLRERVAYALSQIFVVSLNDSAIRREPLAMARYADLLADNAFGDFRTLLEDVTYSPAMGEYLTYLRNRRANMAQGRVPDENYAREVMQLFTIGLVELNDDGTPRPGSPETYDNDDISDLAKVFTGLSWKAPTFNAGEAARDADYPISRMVMFDTEHSTEVKSFLNVTIPAGTNGTESIRIALDRLSTHPNTAPFISRQLIQRLVTSNPSPDYVRRVVAAWRSGRYTGTEGTVFGQGREGDMAAVIAAILLDNEARSTTVVTDSYGRLREPVLLFTGWARAYVPEVTNPTAPGGLINAYRSNRLTQQAWRSPSVFNFYRPGYVPPNTELGGRGLVAPEMQIAHESSVASYVNFMSDYATSTGALGSYDPDYGQWLNLAETPDALVDHVDRRLTGTTMSSSTKARIAAAINAIAISPSNVDRDRERRVQAAVLMAVTSPEYLIQQ